MPARPSKRRRGLSCRLILCSELRRGTDIDGGIDPGDLSWREETFHLALAWATTVARTQPEVVVPTTITLSQPSSGRDLLSGIELYAE
jgi:hypothetical protein